MTNLLNHRRTLALIACLVFASVAAAATVLKPVIKVHLFGSVTRDGCAIKLDEAGNVHPGENLNWSIVVSNSGDAAATNVQAIGQIPQGTVYVPGSANGNAGTSVKYSLDGQAFSDRPVVRVIENGVAVERPASPDQYKAVQFIFPRVGGGEEKKAAYRTRVR